MCLAFGLTEFVLWVKAFPEVIKLFACSTQLSMTFSLLIDVKMPIMFGIFLFSSSGNFMLSRVEHEKSFITSGPGYLVIYTKYYKTGCRTCFALLHSTFYF